jgi:hypothetical protein
MANNGWFGVRYLLGRFLDEKRCPGANGLSYVDRAQALCAMERRHSAGHKEILMLLQAWVATSDVNRRAPRRLGEVMRGR